MKIAIIGGGISGCALARLCAADGHDVTVFEGAGRPGGLCRSQTIDGFVFDEAGGHILFSKNQDVLKWQLERCGGDAGTVRTERQTRIRWHDRWVPYPFENGVGHLTKEAIADCMEHYIEAYADRKHGVPCPENFLDWIHWRMGAGFARHFMVPYNNKIWCGELDKMSAGWVAGRVPEAPIGDVIKSAIGLDTEGYSHQSVFWFPRTGGFESLVKGAVDGGGFTLHCNHTVENVKKVGDHYEVDGQTFDLVVNTAPLPQIESVFEDIPQEIRDTIQVMQPISLTNVLIGVRTDEPIEKLSWVYLPFEEQGPANRITYFSNYSPENAPTGHGSFMAEVTHRGPFEVTQAWLDDLVKAVGRAGLYDPSTVVLTHYAQSRFAYIDQNMQFQDRVTRVREWFDNSGYITFGRFGRYEYHNSDQCIARAMETHGHIRQMAETGEPARPRYS